MFYVYEHWRPDRDEPFYVGKGRGGRANMMARRNKYHKAIQGKLHKNGYAVEVKIVATNLTEEEAFSLEKERISLWRSQGIDLANMTDGGDGPVGREGLKGAANGMYGKPSTFKGKTHSEEARKKISAARKGRKPRLGAVLSEETKRKIGLGNKGKGQKIKGVPKSEEHRKKLSIAVSNAIKGENNPFFGKKHTEETKLKISLAKRRKNCHTDH